MATIIYDQNQADAINIDNVDFFNWSPGEKAVIFYRKAASGGKIVSLAVGYWPYETSEAAESSYYTILEKLGREIAP